MKKLLLLLILIPMACYAFDLDQYVKSLRDNVQELLGNKKEVPHSYKMPELPKVVKDPKAVDVYEKKGKVYNTGLKFKALSKAEKRNFHYHFLKELIFVVREAEATDTELANYINVLEQGGSREGIYRSLVLNADYKELELYQEAASTAVVDFGYNFGAEYLGLQFKKADMQRLNLWSIKRIIVEKTLELIDAFPKDGKNLYIWYGLFSEKMARDFDIWKNKLRQQKNIEAHMKWAESVPFQHLKSEVIVKLNMVFNKLQQDKSL